jgi:hypothetical protein
MWWPRSFLIGVTLYLAFGTRSAGIALPAGLALYEIVKHRKIRLATAVALVVCASLVFLQRWAAGFVAGSYTEQTGMISWHSLLRNSWEYSRALPGFWVGSIHRFSSFMVLIPILALTVAGIYCRRDRGLTIVEAFLVPYTVIILLWPFSAGGRLAFPFLPWLVMLALTGLSRIAATWIPRHPEIPIWGLLLLLAIPNVQAYRRMEFGPIHENIGLPEFSELCNIVRDRTRPEDVFIYYRPRALALYTGRSAATYDYLGTDSELWQWSREIHASYLITTTAFDNDGGFLRRFAENHPSSLELAYHNAKFSLYRIHSIPE